MTRRHFWFALQALVSLTLLVLLLRGLDKDALIRLFVRLPIWFYAASLVVVVGGQVLYAWRWRLLLSAAGVDAPFSIIVRQYFIGMFLNNFFPSTVGGDVAKVYMLGRDHGYRVVTASVLLDRMLGLGLLAVCAAATLWLVPFDSPILVGTRLAISAIAAASVAILLIARFGTGGLPDRLSWLGPRVVAFAEGIQRLRFDMAGALARPIILVQAFMVVAAYFLAIGAIYVAFVDLQRNEVLPFALTTGVAMAIALLSSVPVSINGVGVREQLHATLLLPLGVAPETAVGISLLLYAHTLVASLVGLMLWSRTRGRGNSVSPAA